MLRRSASQSIAKALSRQAAVALLGPRQVGKTTLAHDIADSRPSIYLDLENAADRGKLENPDLFLEQHEDELVVLDEIHRAPELFGSLRGIIDRGRRKGKRTGRFLILGSAAIELLRQSETLAGRIAYVDLTPLHALEIGSEDNDLNKLWMRGGFPDSYLATDDGDSFDLRRDFIRTYLERDVPMFGPRIPAETLENLWIMLAHSQGQTLNSSKLAGSMGVSAPTVTSYVDLLKDLLLLRKLPPFHANVKKRLVKSPKVYVRDSGLLHALLGIRNHDDLLGHPVAGASWEGFVIESLLAVVPNHTKASFYRTATGVEIDLVLEFGGKQGTWAIEIKRGMTAKLERGNHVALDDIQPKKAFVVYPGKDRYMKDHGIEAISLDEMAEELQRIS
ncbi:MAG: ATP-binding protein [Akkermansiaceae bacterium]|nr:ATP-binding protein [Akkermansiaceae bacterium]